MHVKCECEMCFCIMRLWDEIGGATGKKNNGKIFNWRQLHWCSYIGDTESGETAPGGTVFLCDPCVSVGVIHVPRDWLSAARLHDHIPSDPRHYECIQQ